MEGEKTIDIHGAPFVLEYQPTDNRTASAHVRERRILIRLPKRWPLHEKQRAAQSLERRILKRLRHPETKTKPVPDMSLEEKIRLAREALPRIAGRVSELNAIHFQVALGKIRIKHNLTNWGSCSPRNNITLNFALLFVPAELLEYVILHELAHTKKRDHSKEFWAELARTLPDYKTRKKELRRYLLTT